MANRDRTERPITLSHTSFCEELASHPQIRGIDRIVVAMEERRGKLPVDLLLSLKNRGVRVQDGNDVYESITGKVPIESIRLSWLLFSPGSHASRLFLFYKRFASIVISIVGLLLSLPLFPFVIIGNQAQLRLDAFSTGRIAWDATASSFVATNFALCVLTLSRIQGQPGPSTTILELRGLADSFARLAWMRFRS